MLSNAAALVLSARSNFYDDLAWVGEVPESCDRSIPYFSRLGGLSMAPVAQRRFADLDDEDVLDDFDPAYFPRRVYKDGRGPHVRLYADRCCAALAQRRRIASPASDLSATAPSCGMLSARPPAPMTSVLRLFARRMALAGQSAAAALRDGESARDQYVERLQSAYRTPTGRNDPADDIAALQRRWASPGATPGPGRRPTQDAGPRSDADQAYEEYCSRLQSAWKTR